MAWTVFVGASAARAKTPPETIANSIGMKLKLLPAGSFMMGSNSGGRDTKPVHRVTLTRPFYLGIHEVTQQQHGQVIGSNPSKHKGANNPVESVTWNDAVKFCRRLSALPKEKAAGHIYRLPTEAEWEYACRAGTVSKFSFGDDEKKLERYGWFAGNSRGKSRPVGQKKPNPWGIYDMHGNVEEWCHDWYGTYPAGAHTDPAGAARGSFRVVQGGGWSQIVPFLPSAYRGAIAPSDFGDSLGFRVVLAATKPSEDR